MALPVAGATPHRSPENMTRFHLILLAVTPVGFTGCGGYASSWKFDNPTIRKIQNEETARHITDDTSKADIKKHLGGRVRIVFSRDIQNHSQDFAAAGRAAALTQDGYFITAYHVVEDRPFYIQETKRIRRPPTAGFKTSESSRYFSERRYAGRLVWSSLSADVAILKFPVKGQLCFKDFEVAPTQGSIVFTADDEGYGALAADERGKFRLENRVGNGDFFAAGRISDKVEEQAESNTIMLSTTLVARRGMSGAPLMTTRHRLCGVLSRVEGFVPFRKPKTIAAMIDPSLISELINADRKKQKGEQAGAPNP
jgi:S1-C subfamily serine protease